MPSFLQRVGLSRLYRRGTVSSEDQDVVDPGTGAVRTTYGDGTWDEQKGARTLGIEPDADRKVAPGELSFEEDTAGGLGRHLGLFSTTFLM